MITLTGGATHTVTQAGQGVPCELWTPAELGALYAWYDADAPTTIAQAGGLVSEWRDLSGGDRHLTASGAARPTYTSSGLDGKSVVTFNATHWMAASTASDWKFLHDSTGSSVFVVLRYTRADRMAFLWTSPFASNKKGWTLCSNSNQNPYHLVPAATSWNVFNQGAHNTLPINSDHIIGVVDDPGNATASLRSSLRLNGGNAVANNTSSNTASTADPDSPLTLGRVGDSSMDGLEGFIAEVVICDARLSDPDRQRLEGHLAWKWGLEANLPLNHPYRNAAPTVGDCVPTSPLVVNPDTTQLPAPGVIEPVHVAVAAASGASWSAASSEPWLAIAHSATGSPDAFGFTAAANLGMLPRSAIVTVTAADGQTASFEVRQQAPCEHVASGDCDGDGIPDLCAIAWGLATDRNGNSIAYACEAGTTVTVPGDFATLQAALDAAVDGWAIRLDPGTYAGPIVIAERSVTLEAAGPLGSVIFDGSGHPGPVVTIVDDPSRGSLLPTTLRGIVVTGGSQGTPVEHDGATYSGGGGVLAVGAALSIESCLITANHAGHGGGIAAISSLLSIASSEIAGNTADLAGGGIAMLASEALVDGTTIHGNAAPLGAGLWLDETSTAQVSASTVCDNQPDQIAGAWQDLGGNAPCSCVGDLNGDGTVDGSDLATLLASWGQAGSPHDLDGDGVVGGSDLAAIIAAWGECP